MNIDEYGVCANGFTPRGKQTARIRNQKETDRAAAETAVLWDNEQSIKVHFLNGNAKFHEAVKEIAPKWCSGTGIAFNFAQGGTTPDITINFAPMRGGSYGIYNSLLGQAARGSVPSMNLIFPPNTTSREVLTRYIL